MICGIIALVCVTAVLLCVTLSDNTETATAPRVRKAYLIRVHPYASVCLRAVLVSPRLQTARWMHTQMADCCLPDAMGVLQI